MNLFSVLLSVPYGFDMLVYLSCMMQGTAFAANHESSQILNLDTLLCCFTTLHAMQVFKCQLAIWLSHFNRIDLSACICCVHNTSRALCIIQKHHLMRIDQQNMRSTILWLAYLSMNFIQILIVQNKILHKSQSFKWLFIWKLFTNTSEKLMEINECFPVSNTS